MKALFDNNRQLKMEIESTQRRLKRITQPQTKKTPVTTPTHAGTKLADRDNPPTQRLEPNCQAQAPRKPRAAHFWHLHMEG